MRVRCSHPFEIALLFKTLPQIVVLVDLWCRFGWPHYVPGVSWGNTRPLIFTWLLLKSFLNLIKCRILRRSIEIKLLLYMRYAWPTPKKVLLIDEPKCFLIINGSTLSIPTSVPATTISLLCTLQQHVVIWALAIPNLKLLLRSLMHQLCNQPSLLFSLLFMNR